MTSGTLTRLVLELRRGSRVYARARVAIVSSHSVRAVLHGAAHRRGALIPSGAYTLRVRTAGGRVLVSRRVVVPSS
jgi:hypothetical protein